MDIFESHIRFFKQEIRRHGDIKPALVIFKGNAVSLVEPPSRSAFDEIISLFKPDRYMFFSTVWKSSIHRKYGLTPEGILKGQSKEELLKDYKIGDFAKRKDKQEILLCLYISTDKKVMTSIPIKRKGRKVSFGKPLVFVGADVKGRLVKEISKGMEYVV